MKLSIIGAGTVGSRVAELADSYGHTVTAISDSTSAVTDASGVDVHAVLEDKRESGTIGNEESESALEAEYDCLVEVTPSTLGDAEPAFNHIATALRRDRHVVLGNKSPMAQRYRDVRELEENSAGEVLFEATIGGPIPVLSTIHDVGPDRVISIKGVFNGLANFILSRMTAEGLGYEHVLAEAQDLGIAEVDPTFDVEGTDTALTCSILANVLAESDTEFTVDDVSIEGITEIPGSALNLAREDGKTVRLLGEVRDGQLRVAPRTVPQNSPLAVTGPQTVVELDIQDAGQVNVTSSAATSTEVASTILTDVNRLERQ
ncbi:homoserine dehydrogenase [Haloferax namakaokahaiae]|uniref:homoserine dehydrogenase n=1 Tax=Haloferax namakaokahaiae TaxID=1748331 RepID=A0ABD5ZJ61_9EURY